jgi:dienelactone hydrolase
VPRAAAVERAGGNRSIVVPATGTRSREREGTLMNISTRSVPYVVSDRPMTGYLAWDASRTDRRPGVLVVHGGAGLDDHARGRARRFAQSGYVALACDMYGDGVAGNRERVMGRIRELHHNRQALCSAGQAALAVLSADQHVDGRLAAVGYCFGGMTVLELARGGVELAGVVSVHGSLETKQPAQSDTVKPKLLVCHGALDPHVPTAQITAFADEMNTARTDWQLIVYGGAMHGFTHETATAGATPGVEYNETADVRSSGAIDLFFEEIFGAR